MRMRTETSDARARRVPCTRTSSLHANMPVDAFLRIRSQLESQSSPKCLLETDRQHEAKVIARNRECYVTERPDKSILDYERRARHHHTGFASLAHVPYRPFAGLKHTDPYSLIADTMGLPFQQADHIRQV